MRKKIFIIEYQSGNTKIFESFEEWARHLTYWSLEWYIQKMQEVARQKRSRNRLM